MPPSQRSSWESHVGTCMCGVIVFPKAVTVFPPCSRCELLIFQGHWGCLNGISGSHQLLHFPLSIPSISQVSVSVLYCDLCIPERLKVSSWVFPTENRKSPFSPRVVPIALPAAMAVASVSLDRCQCSWLLLSSSMPQLHRLHPRQCLPAPKTAQACTPPARFTSPVADELPPVPTPHSSDFNDNLTAESAALAGTFDTNRTKSAKATC